VIAFASSPIFSGARVAVQPTERQRRLGDDEADAGSRELVGERHQIVARRAEAV
jgi:hypothetical protein